MEIPEMSRAEWEVMRVIGTEGGADTNDIIEVLRAKQNWSDSTTKTLLRRLVGKQALTTVKVGRQFHYSPLIKEQETMQQNANEFFDRMCEMKQGSVLVDLLKNLNLSKPDIETMQAVLADRHDNAPDMVACNCLMDDCECAMEVAK